MFFKKKPLIFKKKGKDIDYINSVREMLGDKAFMWLCSCAIFPKLDYNLVIFIGKIIEDYYSIKLINTRKFDRMLSISWFHNGFIPDTSRKLLIYSMDMEFDIYFRDKINKEFDNSVCFNSEYDKDYLFVNYSNKNLSFILNKEISNYFKDESHQKHFSFRQIKSLFYVTTLLPLYILTVIFILVSILTMTHLVFTLDLESLNFSTIVREVILYSKTIVVSKIGIDLKIEDILMSLVITLFLVGSLSFGLLFSVYINVNIINTIFITGTSLIFPVVISSFFSSSITLSVYLLYIIIGTVVSYKDIFWTHSTIINRTLHYIIFISILVCSIYTYILYLSGNKDYWSTFAVALLIYGLIALPFSLTFYGKNTFSKLIQLALILFFLFMIPIIYTFNILF